MRKKYKEGQIVRKLVPVPTYDISGTENWLSDLAEEGLFLTKNGFSSDVVNIAKFEVKAPEKVKYRLQAMESNGYDTPDSEQLALGEKYNWEYVCQRGCFYIFRSFDSSARELNTDPVVQAMALDVVKRKKLLTLITALLIFFFYPLVLTRGCIILSTISLGFPNMVVSIILGMYCLLERLKAYFHLKKVQKALLEEGHYESKNNWRKSLVPYLLKRNTIFLVIIVLLCSFARVSLTETFAQKISIKEYDKQLPFATIADFAGEGGTDYRMTIEGFPKGSIDVISEKKDLIAPRIIDYNEHAEITRSDSNVINGMLYVSYMEMQNPWLAKTAANEIYRSEKLQLFSEVEKIEPLQLNADSIICYKSTLHAPTIVIQKGNIVLRALFYQPLPEYQILFAEWAEIMCDSIQ